jgi:hypothetical protein
MNSIAALPPESGRLPNPHLGVMVLAKAKAAACAI